MADSTTGPCFPMHGPKKASTGTRGLCRQLTARFVFLLVEQPSSHRVMLRESGTPNAKRIRARHSKRRKRLRFPSPHRHHHLHPQAAAWQKDPPGTTSSASNWTTGEDNPHLTATSSRRQAFSCATPGGFPRPSIATVLSAAPDSPNLTPVSWGDRWTARRHLPSPTRPLRSCASKSHNPSRRGTGPSLILSGWR